MKSAIKPIEIPLASGCAQQASEYAAPPVPRTVTNLRLLQSGALSKRPGARGLAGTTSNSAHRINGNGTSTYVESPSLVSKVGSAPLIGTTSGKAFALDTVQSSLFDFSGSYSSATPVRRRSGLIDDGTFGPLPPAVAVSSAGYTITAGIQGVSSGTLKMFIETPDGVRVFSYQTSSGSVVQVRVHALGTALWMVWQIGTSISGQSFTPGASGVTIGTELSLTTLSSASYYWDTSSYDSTNWFMVYGNAANSLEVDKLDSSGGVAGVTFATSTSTATPCSVWADPANGNVWVGYYDDPSGTGGVNYRVYAASNLATVKGETTLNNGTLYGPPLFGPLRHTSSKTDETTGAFYIYRYRETSGSLLRAAYTGNAWTSGTSPSSGRATWHVLPISKPDSRHRVWCITDNGTANFAIAKLALLRWHDETFGSPTTELALPNMLAPGATYGPANSSMYFHAIATGASSSFATLPRVLTTVDDVPLIACDVIEYATLEQSSARHAVQIQPSTVVAGSPVEFFGNGYGQARIAGSSATQVAGASEVGFIHAPTIISVTAIGGGTEVGAGTYSYQAIYEWTDTYGRRHRSAPSAPVSVTTVSAGRLRVLMTYIRVTQRTAVNESSEVRVVLYRTVNGGQLYQRVVESSVSYGGSSETIQYDDNNSDTELAEEEIIYTDGGVLANDLAPSCRYLAHSEDAVWFGGLFECNIVQRSKIIFPGEPIQCSDHASHQVVLPGECTGLAYMDGQIAAFTRDSILLINSSSGPNDQGVGEFAPPRLHTTGIGCVDGRSVLETPEGIFFLSRRGIELLPRGFGTVQFVGEAIKDLQQTSLLDQCGFSAYQADKNGSYARFGLMTGSSEFSVPSVRYVATFDLNTAQWFVDDYGSETMGAMGAWPLGFALIRTDLDSDTSPTPIWYEDGSLVSQPEAAGAAYIDSSIVVNRLWPFGHAGWGKVRRVLITFYSHVANWTLSLTVQTDENTAQTVTWSVTGTGLQWRQLSVVSDECTSVKATISDTDLSANGAKQAATYLMCALEAEAHDGLRLLAPGDKQ